MAHTFRIIITWFCVISLILPSGCATVPPPLPEEVRAQLGTVAIVPAKIQPDAELDVPAKGWFFGAGRKSARWAAKGALAPLAGSGGCGHDDSGLCVLLVLTLSVAAGTIGGLAGGVAGAFQAEPYQKINAAEDVITAVIASLGMQETLCMEVIRLARSRTSNRVVVAPAQVLASSEKENPYGAFMKNGIDTVLEVAVPRIALVGDWDINPPLQFQMDAHIRLVRTSDGKELYETSYEFKGMTALFSEWSDDNAMNFTAQLDAAYQSIAYWIINEIFLLRPSPEPRESGSDNSTEG